MIRRHRRVVPATIVAFVLLAAMVLLTVSCVQLLLGQQPLVPFATLAETGTSLQWSGVAVLIAGVVSLLLGIVLLIAAWTPGTPTVIPLAATEHSTAGATRHSLRRAVADTARGVDGVRRASATVTPRRVRATITTPLRDNADLAEKVRVAIGEQLSTAALHRMPRIIVRVNQSRSS